MNSQKPLTLIVAQAQNGVIGRDNQLPWHLRSDLQRFKKLTMGHTLIMGRKTFDSIGRVLPGRTSIVLTRSASFKADGVIVVGNLSDAIAHVPEGSVPFVIGGSQIFAEAMPLSNRLLLTQVLADITGNVYFDWTGEGWHRLSQETVPASEQDDYATSFEVWERIATSLD
jgi:dihydrofolate reductase